jgi:hypothetical protein
MALGSTQTLTETNITDLPWRAKLHPSTVSSKKKKSMCNKTMLMVTRDRMPQVPIFWSTIQNKQWKEE